MYVIYSPLCNTSEEAYYRYLEAVVRNESAKGLRLVGSSGGATGGSVGRSGASVVGKYNCLLSGVGQGGEWCLEGESDQELVGSVASCTERRSGDGPEENCVDGQTTAEDSVGVAGVEPAEDHGCGLRGFEHSGGNGEVRPIVYNGVEYASKLERNRAQREKKKMRKKKKQNMAMNWNAVKAGQSGIASTRFFSSCTEQVKNQLIDSRARRYIVENELRERELKAKMAYMDMQDTSRIEERRFELERMKLEINAHKRLAEMPRGSLETVVSSGSISPNSSISLATENRLRKELADVTERLEKFETASGSLTNVEVASPVEKELRIAQYKLELVELEQRAFQDEFFTDADYKEARRNLDADYSDVLLTEVQRMENKSVAKVLGVLGSTLGCKQLQLLAEHGLYDESAIQY